jgi:hypothetical protein
MSNSYDVLNEFEAFDGFEGGDGELEGGDPFIGGLINSIGSALGGLLGESEDELEFEFETVSDPEFETVTDTSATSPAEARQAAALMEMMVDQLAEAEGEGEADQFLPILAGLAPLALKAAKVAAPLAKRMLPQLARGVMNIGRRIVRSPRARQLVRTLPTIARNTAAQVARTYARTGQMNAQTVARALSGQAARVLQTPSARRAVMHRNRRLASGLYRITRTA